jgi:predicted TIM-barrel fold metal-dependent hydrolase
MRTLEAETDKVQARLDGRLDSLLASLDRAGIGRCVLCSIATRPEQFDSILRWSAQIRSPRVIPFPSVHPRDPAAAERIRRLHAEGFVGIKLHPYYQDFDLVEETMFPLFTLMAELSLIVVAHTGFDIAFPRIRRSDPVRVLEVLKRVPDLKLVTTHLGAWDDWDNVRRHLLGKPIYMEISYALEILPPETARSLLLEHPPEYLLFGTDSPWQDHVEALARLRALGLGARLEQAILSGNANRLLPA